MPEKEKNLFTVMMSALKDAFFPLKCLSCGSFLGKEHDISQFRYSLEYPEKGYNHFICDRCVLELKKPVHPLCVVCGRRLGLDEAGSLCGECKTGHPPYKMARSVFYYEGASRSLIHAFKYKRVARLSDYLGLLIYRLLEIEVDSDLEYVLIPVPLHIKKLRSRGFNQAALLVESIKKCNDNIPGLTVFSDELLSRTVNTTPQSGLKRHERSDNVKDAFEVIIPERIMGRHAILVDDVYTTGATVSACAGTLMKAGAASVSVFTLARVRD